MGVRLTLLDTNLVLFFFGLRDTDRLREPDSTDFHGSQPLKKLNVTERGGSDTAQSMF